MTDEPTISPEILSFLTALEAEPAKAGDLWDAEFRRLVAKLTPSSVKLYTSRYRSAIRSRFGDESPFLAVVNGKKLLKRIALATDTPVPDAPESEAVTAEDRVARASLHGLGRPPRLQMKIVEFFEKVKLASSEEEIAALWEEEFASFSHLALSTQKLYGSKYREEARTLLGAQHPACKIIKAPDAVVESVNRKYVQTTAARHRRQVHIPRWLDIVERAYRLIRSTNPFDIGLGLLVLTGRRPFEIFCTATFERQPLAVKGAYDKWHVRFSGQAKTRGAENSKYGEAYAIPVLAPASLIVDAHRRMAGSWDAASNLAVADRDGERFERVPWKDMSNEDFNRAMAQQLSKSVRDHFLDLWPLHQSLAPSSFRPLYAEIAYRHFCSRGISQNSYYAAILGHRLDDLETSLSYIQFYLDDPSDGKTVARLQADLVKRLELIFSNRDAATS